MSDTGHDRTVDEALMVVDQADYAVMAKGEIESAKVLATEVRRLRALADTTPAPPVTDEQAREQAAAAVRRVTEVFDRLGGVGADQTASMWAEQFADRSRPAWLEAARALLGVAALPEEDRRRG